MHSAMDKAGRNDPCPCGSGKKYKKCCLPKDEERGRTAGSSARYEPPPAPPPRRPRQPRDPLLGAMQELLDLITDLLDEGRNALVTTEYHLTMGVVRGLGYSPDALLYSDRAGAEVLLRYLVLGPVALTPRHAEARAHMRAEIGSRLRAFHDAVLEAPFGVYDLRVDQANDSMTAVDALGGGTPLALHNAVRASSRELSFRGGKAAGVVGWILERRGLRILFALGQLTEDGAAELEASRPDWPAEGWQGSPEVVADILSALIDPLYEHRLTPAVPRVTFYPAGRGGDLVKQVVRQTAHQLVRQLHLAGDDAIVLPVRGAGALRKLRWFRERIAAARAPGEVAELVDFVRRLRDERVARAIKSVDWNRRVDRKACEKELPLAEVLGAFGLGQDGVLAGLDEAELERRPAALLLLADDHPVWAAVHRAAPLGGARQWAAGRPEGPSVEAAWARYLAEQRWLATYEPADGNELGLGLRPRYSDLLHAFAALFDPAVREVPLDELDLGHGGASRLSRALLGLGVPPPDDQRFRVRDLPAEEEELLDAKGYGPGTHDRLVEELALVASQWRPRLAGIDPASLGRSSPEDAAGQELLKEGLDELAALFETPDET